MILGLLCQLEQSYQQAHVKESWEGLPGIGRAAPGGLNGRNLLRTLAQGDHARRIEGLDARIADTALRTGSMLATASLMIAMTSCYLDNLCCLHHTGRV